MIWIQNSRHLILAGSLAFAPFLPFAAVEDAGGAEGDRLDAAAAVCALLRAGRSFMVMS
jgi:hypothetical protein